MSRRRSGFTLIEVLVALIITGILLGGIYNVFSAVGSAQAAVVDQGSADIDAISEIDDLSDHLRNAQVFGNSAVKAANVNSFTYYTDAAGNWVRYALAGTDLQRITGFGVTTVMRNVQSLQCSYSELPQYYGTPIPTAVPTAPSAAELPLLAAVKITVQISKNGCVASYNTTVRLRNSPPKKSIGG